MAISTRVEPASGHGWQTGFVRLWRGVRWMLWLSGAMLLSLLTGTVFYIITGLSQWAALLLLSILVLVALFRRWPLARRAMLADRLMQAEPWIWAGALIAGVGASVVLVWRGETGAAWLVLGLVGLGLVLMVNRQADPGREQVEEIKTAQQSNRQQLLEAIFAEMSEHHRKLVNDAFHERLRRSEPSDYPQVPTYCNIRLLETRAK